MFRILHASASWLVDGCEVSTPEEPVGEWMATMGFATARDRERSNGLSPLHFACMTGRADLVDWLLDRGAPINCAAKKDELRFIINKGDTPLFTATAFARDTSLSLIHI